MFKNMKLTTKILSSMSILIIGMLIITATSYNGIHKIGNEIKEIAEYEAPLLNVITKIEKDVLKEEVLTLELIISSKNVMSKEFKHISEEINKLEEMTTKDILACINLSKKAANHAHDLNLKNRYLKVGEACQLFKNEQKVFEKHLIQLKSDLTLGHLENIDNQQNIIMEELMRMDEQALKVVQIMEELSDNLIKQAEKDEKSILLTVELTSVIFLLLAIAITILLNKEIKRKIDGFQEGLLNFFKYLNRENSDVHLLNDTCNDEMGTMAKVVNENINKTKIGIEQDRQVINDTIMVLAEFGKGDLGQRVTTNSSNPALEELTTLLNQMGSNIESNIEKALNILGEYSNSNYMNRVDTQNIKEHLLKLANGVNILGDSTTKLLTENLVKGLSLQENATTLNDNVSKLSTSSNQQAASLEESSAALEEITSTIASNAGNVTKMSSLTNDLSSAVKIGENLANETSTSMNLIDEKVSSINEAIAIIDQIAFQTNIHSLNAAVEAATAGEAGKGFAVVAAEVRNLATRSADAAKEIKELVQDATSKADEGKGISAKMIEGYNDLNGIILTTVELINEVSTASSEQQKGIEQINDAISQLDKATQKNAVIASQTNDIANDTTKMALEIVEEVNKSEFNGKNNIKTNKKSIENRPLSTANETIQNKAQKEVKKTIIANNDTDEWESF
ncbi:MAG: hypothetical protein CL623_07880 [Arcobacter sp.]|nr:hypothetical protein [Arcobacter sp.]